MRKHGVSDGSVGNSALAVAAERTPGAETARSRSRASSYCRVCWSLPGMIGRGASCADTVIGISQAADSNATGIRIVINVVLFDFMAWVLNAPESKPIRYRSISRSP